MNAPVDLSKLYDSDRLPLVASMERKRLRAYLLLLVGDLASLALGFLVAGAVYHGQFPEPQTWLQAQLFAPIFATIALYQRCYSIRALDYWAFGLKRVALSLLVAALLLNFVAFYAKFNANFSRATFTLGIVFTLVLATMLRRAIVPALARSWGGSARNILILDDGGPSFELAKARRAVAGDIGLAPVPDDPAMMERLGKVLANQDQVIVSCPLQRRDSWAFILKAYGVQGEIVSEQIHALGGLGVNVYDASDRSTLLVSTGPLGLRARIAKRLFDVVIGGGLLLIASPLMIVVAIAIRLQDGGPSLFIQRRTGRGNRMFPVLKFRTMAVSKGDGSGAVSTRRDDSRITPFGRFLRRTSIDELPQLLNVLRGEMSLVGPRPHAIGSQAGDKHFWDIDGRYWQRHALKPGMTGLAQIRGFRGATQSEDDLTNRLQADLEYVAQWSLYNDAAILLRTLPVLRHANAY